MTTKKTTETEDQLVARAQNALSSCNWEIGECAAQWTQRYAAGRTDVDFGMLIGLSGDQVYQRRRVWERFADEHEQYPTLKWSHYYVALNWENAAECLTWANDMEATVAEMRAWRRAQQGEDLTAPAAEEPPFDMGTQGLTLEMAAVRDPGEFAAGARGGSWEGDSREAVATAASAARDSGGSEYAPFSKGARGPAQGESASSREKATTEQIVSKATGALERIVSAMTPEVLDEFPSLSLDLQQRFLDAVETLQSRAAGLSP